MPGKYGVSEIKDFLDFAVSIAVDTSIALADGKWDWLSDSVRVGKNLVKLPAAVNDLKELKNQVMEIDSEDRQEILSWAKEKFNYDETGVDEIVNDALNLLTVIMEFVAKYGKNN